MEARQNFFGKIRNLLRTNSGQSLVEILVATAVGVIMILGALTIITPALKGNTQAAQTQVGVGLGKELMDNVRVWSEANWHNLYNLSKGSDNRYYLNTASSPFSVLEGMEAVTVSTTTYTRYFYAENVSRDVSGMIVQIGGTNDPSTQKITVVYGWPQSPNHTMVQYLTRFRNQVYIQKNWSGGPGVSGPLTLPGNQFASSTNINYSTTTGSIRIYGI